MHRSERRGAIVGLQGRAVVGRITRRVGRSGTRRSAIVVVRLLLCLMLLHLRHLGLSLSLHMRLSLSHLNSLSLSLRLSLSSLNLHRLLLLLQHLHFIPHSLIRDLELLKLIHPTRTPGDFQLLKDVAGWVGDTTKVGGSWALERRTRTTLDSG